mgnify:CR=1 FL=1
MFWSGFIVKKYNGLIKWNENYRFLNFNDKFKKLKVKYKKDMKKYIGEQ